MVLVLRYVPHGRPWPGSSAKPGLPLAASAAAASGPPINHSQLPQQPAPPPLPPPPPPPPPTQSQSRDLQRERESQRERVREREMVGV